VIELTDEMRATVKRRMGVPEGVELDPWMDAAIGDVLALVERDYLLTPFCNAELMPGAVCKRTAINPRHKHEAILPATGSRVEWS
jgi:hypothetical protein